MCGRFAYFGKGAFGHESLHLPEPPRFENYNITPSQDILAIRTSPETGHPEYTMLHWGLVPFWSKSVKTKFPLINARSEGIETKPSFRDPFKRRRCIIPASGFYEWQKVEEHKQPYFIRPVDGRYFALAGLWDSWRGENSEDVNSCAIITTTANAGMKEIHDRMPVILGNMDIAAWLDPGKGQADLLAMLEPYPESLIEIYPVSSMVNSPRNNGPECVKRSLLGTSS
jgi:putative SOS response-associated peptidase YedK